MSIVHTHNITRALSAERLHPYLVAEHGDLRAALRLYRWNLAVSAAMFEAIGLLEVVLRNALCAALEDIVRDVPGQWYEDPRHVLSPNARAEIALARRHVAEHAHPETPGRVVAGLTFAFWKCLLSTRYEESLWRAGLHEAFGHMRPRDRETVYQYLEQILVLRNRIAHHEPIFRRDLVRDLVMIYRVIDWIHPELRMWALSISRVQETIADRPGSDGSAR